MYFLLLDFYVLVTRLLTFLQVDFNDALARNAFELQRDTLEKQRQSKVAGKKADELKIEMEEKVEDISRIITEMNSCFGLLIPKPDELFQDESDSHSHDDAVVSDKIDLREHGIVDRRTVISIELPSAPHQLKVNDDNTPVIENLKDLYLELKNGYATAIRKWVKVASKAGKAFEAPNQF